jgi:hypothetical protein
MTDTHNNHDDALTHCALNLTAWDDAYGVVEAEEERLLREEGHSMPIGNSTGSQLMRCASG